MPACKNKGTEDEAINNYVVSVSLLTVTKPVFLSKVYLGQFPYKRFTESQVQSDMESLQTRLEALSGSIRVRNENLDFPYTFMDPAKIPNSIA